MRSIHVHLVNTSLEEVRKLLTGLAKRQTEDQWLYPPSAEHPFLYIETPADFSDFEPDYLTELAATLGKSPDVSIMVNVSGRIPGDDEVGDLLNVLLTQFEGVANDEYSPHFWRLREIQTDTKMYGHPFFDYKGWHLELAARTGP